MDTFICGESIKTHKRSISTKLKGKEENKIGGRPSNMSVIFYCFIV